MRMTWLDWALVAAVIVTSVVIGLVAGRKAGESSESFFLGHRSLPWWLLGFSMVATTFSTDTPNLVTDLTRRHGIAGNWSWWAFLLTGSVTTFFFARLWRRSGVTTDIEFYELRYSGRPAAFLRVVRALYIGMLFNVLIMAAVTLAATKFGAVILGLSPVTTIAVAGSATVIFATYGGLRGVLYSDLFLFIIAIVGAYAAATVALDHPSVGGLRALLANPAVQARSDFIPSLSDPTAFVSLLMLPLLVQWWSVWYPGSEPGGGGYVAQRMLAARSEGHAVRAMIFFNIAHYALRPWPWILVALASVVVFPDLASLRVAFPTIDPAVIGDDMAYPAMLTFLPSGWLGFVAASLIAAYMSTMATQLNLGSSYFVTDIYARFLKPNARDAEKVRVGRVATIVLMVLTGALALSLKTAGQTFAILLSVGAGTGLIFTLRFYWHRVNAWSEIAAMAISLIVSISFNLLPVFAGWSDWARLVAAVSVTTVGWVAVALLTPPESSETLQLFYNRTRPAGPGWRAFKAAAPLLENDEAGDRITLMFVATLACVVLVYSLLFAMGFVLREQWLVAGSLTVLSAAAGVVLRLVLRRQLAVI